jgi:hypothetical protein
MGSNAPARCGGISGTLAGSLADRAVYRAAQGLRAACTLFIILPMAPGRESLRACGRPRTRRGDTDPFLTSHMGNGRRFKRAMKANLFRGGLGGGVKMSEVLLDFADPLLRGFSLPEDRETFVAALKIASVLWNEAVRPGKHGANELYATLNDAVGAPRDPDMEKIFDAMIARGRLLYGNLDRIITGVHVDVDGNGQCTVRVISAV